MLIGTKERPPQKLALVLIVALDCSPEALFAEFSTHGNLEDIRLYAPLLGAVIKNAPEAII